MCACRAGRQGCKQQHGRNTTKATATTRQVRSPRREQPGWTRAGALTPFDAVKAVVPGINAVIRSTVLSQALNRSVAVPHGLFYPPLNPRAGLNRCP
jgi:hypothetical protein